MSQQNNVKFATFGPNRGLSFNIGAYEFIDGICEVPEKDASSASSILTRYHDVCHAHELDQKIAEYDTEQQNKAAAASGNPKPEKPAAPQPGENPPAEKPEAPAQPGASKEQPAPGAGTSGEGDPESKKNGNGKKQPGKN